MKGNVLVVSDNVNERVITETLLRARGFSVLTAGDGVEAYEAARERVPDVVVLDLALAGMNGWELIRRLRGRFEPLPLAARPRVIAMTGRIEPETELFTRRLGADAVLCRPVVPRDFLDEVERLAAEGAEAPLRAAV